MSDGTDVLTYDNTSVEPVDRERFKIQDDWEATWAMRKIAAARTRIDEIQAIADSEVARVQEWAEQEGRESLRDLDYFEGLLIEYGIAQRTVGRKSVSTPYGAIKSRTGQAKYVFVDKEQFLVWARTNRPDWVAVKEEPALSAMRENHVLAAADPDTGEMIPGLQVEPPSVSFRVEVVK